MRALDRIREIIIKFYLYLTHRSGKDTAVCYFWCNTHALPRETIETSDIRDFDFDHKCKKENTVVGSLKKFFLFFWGKNKKASEFVQTIVEKGYVIPFLSAPPSFFAKNNKSSFDHIGFVENMVRTDPTNKRCFSWFTILVG